MKTMKKLFALLLALTMVFGLAATAFAAVDESATSGVSPTDKGKIVIQNPDETAVYNAYRLLDLESWADTDPDATDTDNKDVGKYSYVLNETWKNFFVKENEDAEAPGAAYVDISTDGHNYVTWKTDKDSASDMEAFAKAALAWAKEKKITADATSEDQTVKDGKLTLSPDELPLGYYLVNTSLGSLCSLGTTDNVAEIREKNEETKELKEVMEDSDGKYSEENTADIGDTVNFRVTITAQEGAENYVYYDRMAPGLTWSGETSIKIYHRKYTPADGSTEESWSSDDTADLVDSQNYTVSKDVEHGWSDGEAQADFPFPSLEQEGTSCTSTFEISFVQTFLDGLKDNDKLEIVYTAVVNDDAEIIEINENDSVLTYGDGHTTAHSKTKTKTYPLNIWKYWNDPTVTTGDAKKALAGAEFVLYTKNEEKFSYLMAQKKPAGNSDENWAADVWHPMESTTTPKTHWWSGTDEAEFDFMTTTDTFGGTKMTTTEDGYIKIEGLDAGTYYLKETKAPTGYNKLEGDIKVVIGKDGSVEYYNIDKKGDEGTKQDGIEKGDAPNKVVNVVEVLNNTGRELPSTGGMGTTLFYIVGSLLVLGAAVTLVAKKRTNI